jgi:methyl-accepting chemotaxis protein
MTMKKLFVISYSIIIIGIILLGALSLKSSQNDENVDKAEDQRYYSYLLADELRQSSDDLTRLARTYVISGDSQYEKMYWDILAIRNGLKPRPQEYERIYWDLVLTYGKNPRPDGEKISLQKLMENAGFTQEEFAKLKQAQDNSDGLVKTETIAMNAVKGLYDDGSGKYALKGEPDFEMARRIMHDEQYHKDKASIMKPIDEFFVLLNERTRSEVLYYDEKSNFLRMLIKIMVAVLVVFSMIIGFIVTTRILKQVGGEPAYIAYIAEQVAAGNLNLELKEGKNGATGIYASIRIMVEKLRGRDEVIKRTTDETLRINRALDCVTTNVIITNSHFKVIYLNDTAKRFFEREQEKIRRDMPSFDAHQMLNKSFDFFHKNPSHQSQIVNKMKTSRSARISIGGLTIDHTVTPVINERGELLGLVVEFNDKTTEVTIEKEVNDVIDRAARGDFSQRIDLENKIGFFKTVSLSFNQIIDFNQRIIDDITSMFSALAQGNLTRKIENDYIGVFEQLKNDANSTSEKLIDVIVAIKEMADAVSKIASEISYSNTNLSQRTEEQAAALEETAASIEEMTGSVQQNADNALLATRLAISAKEKAEQGGKMVNSTVVAISDINESSKRITEIISVINAIAFQTNLLALNAAVEAARAGEQGRGFSVVASEVRSLAQRTSESAKEIKKLIEDNVTKIDEGTRLVNESGETLKEIVESVKKVSDIVSAIASASQEQSSGIHQVNKAIGQMDEMTQQNSSMVQEAASASDSMNEQAQSLKKEIAFFDIGKVSTPQVEVKKVVQTAAKTDMRKPAVHLHPPVHPFHAPVHKDLIHKDIIHKIATHQQDAHKKQGVDIPAKNVQQPAEKSQVLKKPLTVHFDDDKEWDDF